MFVHSASALECGGNGASTHHAHRYRLDIPQATDEIVPHARHWVRDLGTSLGLDQSAVDDLELLISELVANVGRHADGGPAWATLAVTAASLVLGVGDHRPERPIVRRRATDEDECLRGLAIAYALASIRVDKRRQGTKRVVATLPYQAPKEAN